MGINKKDDRQCCFCGSWIKKNANDLAAIVISFGDDGSQELYCHAQCFKRALYPGIPTLIDDDGKDRLRS